MLIKAVTKVIGNWFCTPNFFRDPVQWEIQLLQFELCMFELQKDISY